MGSWGLALLFVKWESVAGDIWHVSNSRIAPFLVYFLEASVLGYVPIEMSQLQSSFWT